MWCSKQQTLGLQYEKYPKYSRKDTTVYGVHDFFVFNYHLWQKPKTTYQMIKYCEKGDYIVHLIKFWTKVVIIVRKCHRWIDIYVWVCQTHLTYPKDAAFFVE